MKVPHFSLTKSVSKGQQDGSTSMTKKVAFFVSKVKEKFLA
jgi:hypothetical protein